MLGDKYTNIFIVPNNISKLAFSSKQHKIIPLNIAKYNKDKTMELTIDLAIL